MFLIQFKLKKILLILFFSKNLDPIFYRSTINVLKFIGKNKSNNNQKLNGIYKPSISRSSNVFVFIYLNILSTTILSTSFENKLFKFNKEVSIYNRNRHKFSVAELTLLKKELRFQLQKELYYNESESQKFITLKTRRFFEKLHNIKYL